MSLNIVMDIVILKWGIYMGHRILGKIILFACVLVAALSINISAIFAADVTISGITYNGDDYTKLKTFLNLNSEISGTSNGKILNSAYDENNPVTWTGITWSGEAVKCIKSISWSKKSLAGDLDLSGAIMLTSLYCDSNELTKLDVSNCSLLTYVSCYSNKLTSLNVSGDIMLTNLYCQANQLSDLQVASNTELKELHCDSNKLTQLNVSANKKLTFLRCYSNQLSELDVSNNTALTQLYCNSNKLTSLNISNNLALNYLACYSNQLTSLDVSANNKLAYLYCQANQLSVLDVKNNTALKELHCDTNKLTSLDVSANVALTYLRCYSNQISDLKVDKNTALTYLSCQTNKLSVLDVSNNKLLTYLACYSNQLSKLEVGNNKALTILYCQLNQLTELDVSNNELLTELHCYSNQLTSLKINQNAKLKTLWCYSNKLNTLDLNKSTELMDINCKSNNLNKIITNISNKIVDITANGNGYVELFKNSSSQFLVVAVPKTADDFANWMQADMIVSTNLIYNLNLNTIYYLKANFSQNVTFDSQGGSAIPGQTVSYNSIITEPTAEPIKDDCEFKGWYKEDLCINGWDFLTDRVTSYTVLYAKWIDTSSQPVSYTAKFDTNGGSEVADILNITSGSAITVPNDPTKSGCIFKGWYKEAEFLNAWDFDTDVITGNTTLYAKWEEKVPDPIYIVMFDVNGGSKVARINAIKGSTITAPNDPTNSGFEFKGWYKDSAFNNAWNFASDIVTEDIILYAKWETTTPQPKVYTAKFDTNGGSAIADITNITYGSTITAPNDPTKSGSEFKGWYKEFTYGNAWDFATDIVTEDITLYAKWETTTPQPLNYTVKFDTNGGSAVADIINITSGSAITVPNEPTKQDYEFKGWYKEATLVNQWDFAIDLVTSDIILYAKWSEKKLPESTFVVMFDSNGGSKVAAIKDIIVNTAITKPENPIKSGYDFIGWYRDSSLNSQWNFGKDVVLEDMILYAKWEEKSGNSAVPVLINPNPQNNNAPIIINGKTEFVAENVADKLEGRTRTRIILDNKEMLKRIEKIGMHPLIIIPVSDASEIKIAELDGQTVKSMEEKDAVIEISTGQVSYTLPVLQINIGKVIEELGNPTELKNITVKIEIGELSVDIQNLLQATADKDNYKVVTKPVEFKITCDNGVKSIDVSRFNRYVKRTIAIPNDVDLRKITTGIVLNSDGTFSHVPTSIDTVDGKNYVKINSLTNSVYSVIWNPRSFDDVENHWSKDAVNDMGARLVVNGVGNENFLPNRAVTRAEFAEIVVKGLGLMRTGTFKSSFKDLDASTWYYNSIAIASEYGLISGYGNGKFGPNDKVTREQAMTIIAKAMKITGLDVEFSIGDVESILNVFGDSKQSSYYAMESIAACVKTGIVSGKNGHMIDPQGNITRAETAVIVRNLLRKSDLI